MKHLLLVVIAASVFSLSFTPSADALPDFKKAFTAKYITKNEDEAFKKIATKESCQICHVKGAKKKKGEEHLNDYGMNLDKLIPENAKERISEAQKADGVAGKKKMTDEILKELEKAFVEVEKTKAKAGDTYGDRIKAGKLPGTPAEAKK